MKQKNFTFFTTISSCGQKCKHCYNILKNGKKVFKTIQEVKNIINILDSLNNEYKNVNIILNDDPFTHKDIIEIMNHIKSKKINITKWPITNGLAISKRNNISGIIEKYKEIGIDGVGISIFGLEKKHDEFVGIKGAYSNAIKAIEILKSKQLDFSINLFLTSNNFDDVIILKEMYKEKVNICIFGNSSQLEYNENNQKYWAKYKDLLILREKGYLDGQYGNEYLSVKEILERINDDKFLYDKAKGQNKCNKWLLEINYNVYDTVFHSTLDKIGNINFDSIDELLVRSSFFTYIYKTFYEKNKEQLRETLIKWINLNDENVYSVEDLLETCFRKDVKKSLQMYWHKLPIDKISIYAEQKVVWNFIPKLDMFSIQIDSNNWYVKGIWGKIINEMLQGKNFSDSLHDIQKKSENTIVINKIIKDKFLNLIFQLYKKRYIYIVIYD